jgi:hypothetical protein
MPPAPVAKWILNDRITAAQRNGRSRFAHEYWRMWRSSDFNQLKKISAKNQQRELCFGNLRQRIAELFLQDEHQLL